MKINLGLALILTAALSCSRNDLPLNGVQRCAAVGNTRCPAGYECVSDLCWLTGTAPAIDGGATDGMAIDGAIVGDGGSTCDPQTQNNVNGGCETKCTPTTTSCNPSGASVRLCSDTGSWADISMCSSGCQNNACNECNPGKTRCTGTNNGDSQTCGSDGKWVAVITPCTTGCTDGVCNECSGGPTCTNDGKLQACINGKRGTPVACEDGKYCSAGACISCPSVAAACTGVGSFCSSNPVAVVKCETNVTNKCLTLVSTANCQVPANGTATCANATCGTACNDPCTGGPRCGPSGGVQTCVAGTCPTWSAEQTCPADKGTCSNGACVACVAGTTRPCSASGKKGTCAGGIETCNAGAWGACSVQPATMDTCAPDNDDTCDGSPYSGCTCEGFVVPNSVGSGLPNTAAYDSTVQGVVTDTASGLSWQHPASTSSFSREDAIAYCAAKGPGWRVPNVAELMSIVDLMRAAPAIDLAGFPSTPSDHTYFTNITRAEDSTYAWLVKFDNGTPSTNVATSLNRVRCVKTTKPRCYAGARLQVTAGVVYDKASGLTWQQSSSPIKKTWTDAKAYCASIGSGFRLPSARELITIIDYTKAQQTKMIDTIAFPNTAADGFWSASEDKTFGATGATAWSVYFNYGLTTTLDKSNVLDVRCVK
jgi:hypothetical protein